MWKLGSQVRISTPEGAVYVAPNRVHNHGMQHVAFFTVGSGGKNIAPFIVSEDFLTNEDFSDNLERISLQLEEMI